MFVLAYPEDSELIAWLDSYSNKYIAKGGNLAWRINNPGLIRCHSHVAKKNGSIGACGPYSIFATPEDGYNALLSWLHLKKYYNSRLKAVARQYQPNNPEGFIAKLSNMAALPKDQKLNTFTAHQLQALAKAIAKLCHFTKIGNEELTILPRIVGKVKKGKNYFYLTTNEKILSLDEAIEWIQSHRLDASVVHKSNGTVYLRSRPGHTTPLIGEQDTKSPAKGIRSSEKSVETIARSVGRRKADQCVWGFINGISNTKAKSSESAKLISSATGGEEVLYLPNDTQYVVDVPHCFVLKATIDTPVVFLAEKFFRYLLAESKQNQTERPIIIFAHSQGAIIAEHALHRLTSSEREKLRIFTLGGASFIVPGASHPDSHNYASAADVICRLGSPNLQTLALFKFEGLQKGWTEEKIIEQLAIRDALLHLDSSNAEVIMGYARNRAAYYEQEFLKICNITVLDPEDGCSVEHCFNRPCYQNAIREIITKYQARKEQHEHY